MQNNFRTFIFVTLAILLTACGVQPGTQLPTSTTQPKAKVIISKPVQQPPIIGEGLKFEGNGKTSDQVVNVDADGRYRFEWAIAAPHGGRVELINKDQNADLIFRNIILSNMDRPSEGFFDLALTQGEYTLRVDLEGNWAFTFSLVQKLDL